MIKNSVMKKVAIFVCIVSMFTSIVSADTGFSAVEEANSSIISLPSNGVKGQISPKIFGKTIYSHNNNGVNYGNWSGTGIIFDANGIHFDNPSETASIPALTLGLKANTQYTVIYNVTNYTMTGSGIAFTRVGDTFDNGLSYLTAKGFYKKLLTTKADITGLNMIIAASGNNQAGETATVEIYAIIEGDYTADNSVNKPFKYGANSTLPVRIKSVGKNLHDKSKVIGGYFYNSSGVLTADSLSEASEQYIRVKPSTQYVTNENVFFSEYDANKSFIQRIGELNTITTSSETYYIKLSHYQNGNGAFDTIQIEEGTTATDYEEYQESIQYITLPEGVDGLYSVGSAYDEVKDGKLYMRTNKAILDGAESWIHHQTYTNSYQFKILDWANNGALQSTNGSTYGVNSNGEFDSLSNEGLSNRNISIGSIDNDNDLYLNVEKTFVDSQSGATLVEKLGNLLASKPITLIYQLATEQVTDIPTTPLIGYPNGTIIIEPAVSEGGIYDGNITINNSDLPIESIESVKRINGDSTRTMIDLSNIIIAADGKSFTITGAADGESYEYEYMYTQELTTIPTISYSVPIDQNGQISGNTNMIQQNSELIDLILQEIQLLRDEINTMQ